MTAEPPSYVSRSGQTYPLAAHDTLVANGSIPKGETVVLLLMGSGLKATQLLGERMGFLPLVTK